MKPGKLAILAILAAFALASCASAPKPVESPAPAQPAPAAVATPPAPAPASPAPDELRAKAAALRSRAFDLGMKDVLPEDYAAADIAYIKGMDNYGKDNTASGAAFADAAARFSAVIDKGLPLLAASLRQKAEAMKVAADGKGAASFTEQYGMAEARLAAARGKESSGAFEASTVDYRASLSLYEILYMLSEARDVRAGIVKRDYAKWDPSNWQLAEAKFESSKGLFKADAKASRDAADEARLRYRTVARTAGEYWAGDRRTASNTAMAKARTIKAEVAVKDEFATAQALHAKAEELQAAKDFDAASDLFSQAADTFAAAYTHAKAKSDQALSDMEQLDAALAATKTK